MLCYVWFFRKKIQKISKKKFKKYLQNSRKRKRVDFYCTKSHRIDGHIMNLSKDLSVDKENMYHKALYLLHSKLELLA